MPPVGFIYIVPLGCHDMNDLETIALGVEEQFEIETRLLENKGPPDFAYDPLRTQYNSNLILKRLLETAPPDALKVLGVTDFDLFSPIFSYVFGEAQFNGKCAVISSFRLRGVPEGGERLHCPPLLDRLEKEAVHELGHTFGLRHCSDSDCVMSYSKGVQCADRKFGVFCSACRDLLFWYMAGNPVP
ncbi:MAG: archaemetzincin family Zn-dependent metalloprotease [Desulfobacteraceae bacterium]|nr:archaemetzincin family Zn-dependent metalloprotease [Desulfobacteraceae bacterium]